MENRDNAMNKVDKVKETLAKELEGLNEEGLHGLCWFSFIGSPLVSFGLQSFG